MADIGIPAGVISAVDGPRIELLTAETIRPAVPVRPAESHKGDYGRVAIVAGSRGRTGAARLAGLGALRAGAGLVTVATAGVVPRHGRPGAGVHDPGAARRSEGWPRGADSTALLAEPWDVVAAGPGLGTGPGCRAIVDALLDRPGRGPLVLDADALTVCAEDPGRLRGRPEAPVVITPHPGEMARLVGATVADIQRDRVGAAHEFATDRGVHVVLKGARTVVAHPDGDVLVNTTGNPGMATGGSGDVLTGVSAAWLAQVEDVGAAVALAVHLHGLAGDLAAEEVGETGLIARDIAHHLGRAVGKLTGRGVHRMTRTHASRSEADTMRIARELAATLVQTPAAVLLYGDLGAGKTAFVRGLVEGAGGCPDEVSSPTFVLMQEYPGRRLVHHVDLYRLRADDVADLEPLLDEMLAGDAIVAIEWADRLPHLPEPAVRVRIADQGGDDREITVDGPGGRARRAESAAQTPGAVGAGAAGGGATRSGSSGLPW